MDRTYCPECGAPAEVAWRSVMESTDGPIEHAKVRCSLGHGFLLPVAALDRQREPYETHAVVRSAWVRNPH